MAKAVAEAHGWPYTQHGQFFQVMRRCEEIAGDDRLSHLWPSANLLHTFFYTRKRLLSAETIGGRLGDIETMLDILEPLAHFEARMPPTSQDVSPDVVAPKIKTTIRNS